MFSPSEKSAHISRQQQTAGATFFRKAGENDLLGNQKRPSFFPAPVQAKLTVSSPDDPQEKEADAAADKVMRMAEPAAPVAAAVPKEEEKLDRKEEKEEEKVQAKPEAPLIAVQRKEDEEVQAKCDCCMHGNDTLHTGSPAADAGEEKEQKVARKNIGLHRSDVIQCSGRGPPAGSTDFEQSLSSTKGQGSPMPAATQQFMENGFNADFSGVRIHTGSHAENLSRSINAQAFTHGNDIYFNSNKYSPNTHDGGTLLAHELTHTIQQGGVQRKIIQAKPKDHLHNEDGQGVKRRMHSKVKSEVGDDADFNKSPGQMTAEERTKARDIDPTKKKRTKSSNKISGNSKAEC